MVCFAILTVMAGCSTPPRPIESEAVTTKVFRFNVYSYGKPGVGPDKFSDRLLTITSPTTIHISDLTVRDRVDVKKGRPFNYQVSASGVRVRITFHDGTTEHKLIETRNGLNFSGSFIPTFSGKMSYAIDAFDEGSAEGTFTFRQ